MARRSALPVSHFVRAIPAARPLDVCPRCGEWLSPGASADLRALEDEGATFREALAEVHFCPRFDPFGEALDGPADVG